MLINNIIRKKDSLKEQQLSKPVEENGVERGVTDIKSESSNNLKTSVTVDREKTSFDESTYKRLFFKEIKNIHFVKTDIFLLCFISLCAVFLNWFMGISAQGESNDKASGREISLFDPIVVMDASGIEDYNKKYKSIFSKKKVFTALLRKKRPARNTKKRTIHDIKKNLKLLGIIWEDNNVGQAIIQLKGSGTQYVREGDGIEDAEVERIEEGRVIIRYGDETTDLNL